MTTRRILGFLLIFSGVAAIGLSLSAPRLPIMLSPLPNGIFPFHFSQSSHYPKKEIFGFLPFWNLKEEPSIRYAQLSTIAFFGLDVAPNGTIRTQTADGYEEPGWTAYRSGTFGTIVRKAHDSGTKVVLVLRAFDNDTIESVLLDKKKQEKLIAATMDIIRLKRLDGVNIDFEYVGSPPKNVRNQFTAFIGSFRSTCNLSLVTCNLSIDAYADAATATRIWDIPAIEEEVDHIVVMAYDFTRPSSDYSGPVAPLQQIKESVVAYLRDVPPNKLLLGVPYYGYEWPTYSKEPVSKTKSEGYIATYKRVKELVGSAASILGWDSESFTPYLISTESGQTSQIFYDDTRSLGLKYDFINETNLGGVAIWALGYDTPNTELWGLLKEKFGTAE